MSTALNAKIGRRPRIDAIGAERAPVVVLDDFFGDPQGLVEIAACSEFRSVSGHFYPGVRAPARDEYVRALVSSLRDIVRNAFDLRGFDIAACESDFSLVTIPPERLRVLQCAPHFDTTDIRQIAVLHYLCGGEQGGTAFYRHRGTGYESIDRERHDPYMRALGAELKATGPPARRYIDGDTNLFERISSVDAAFNRVLIYRSASLHSGTIGPACSFTSDARAGRLTINTFLHFRATSANPWPAQAGSGF